MYLFYMLRKIYDARDETPVFLQLYKPPQARRREKKENRVVPSEPQT